jgi:hypothetical protein
MNRQVTEDEPSAQEESPQEQIPAYAAGMSVVAGRIYRELLEILEQRMARDKID